MGDYELTRRAVRDIAAARDWYDQRNADLGNRFLDDVLLAVREATDHFGQLPAVDERVRAHRCRRFPYRVYVEQINRDRIRVLAIYHTARDPNRWDDGGRK